MADLKGGKWNTPNENLGGGTASVLTQNQNTPSTAEQKLGDKRRRTLEILEDRENKSALKEVWED